MNKGIELFKKIGIKEYKKEIDKLAKMYPNAFMICASDEEGNSFDVVGFMPTVMYCDMKAERLEPVTSDTITPNTGVCICVN